MPSRTWTLEDRLKTVPTIFDQVQNTTSNHSKNYVALYKVHQEAVKVTEAVNNGEGVQLTGERAFEDSIIDIVNRVLVVKKGESVADRVVKFIGGYLKFGSEKTAENKPKDDEDEGSAISRMSARLIRHLLKGCLAKDKVVRYRCVQILAEILAHMDEIDDGLYSALRTHLMERVRDKEATIRVQAAVALSKLAGSEDLSELDDDDISIADTLVQILRYDSSPEVRRAALLSIPLSPRTVKPLLTRTRDVDPGMRKLLYANVLFETLHHPKQLSIAQRVKIVKDGLGDRDPNVRNAASKLVASWFDTLEGSFENFLRIFDLIDPESSPVAEEALKSVFNSRPQCMDSCDFNEEYWAEPTPSKTFLARVFVEYCILTKDTSRQEAALPVVTFLAFKIQSSYNAFLERIQELSDSQQGQDEEEDEGAIDEKQEEIEFIIGEMLKLAVHLDYADEIGRRKMFGLVREMISQDALPQSLVSKCLDVMRNLASGERDLIRVIVEVIQELRDTGEMEKEEEIEHDNAATQMSESPRPVRTRKSTPTKELSEEEQMQQNAVNLRCLDLCHGMLERVNGTFEENSTLEGVLADLIVPSVKRKEFALREKGLICLGLCCLIAKRMALNSFQLFMSQMQTAPELLKLPVLKVVFDILMVHGREFLYSENAAIPPERITEFLLYLLQNEEAESVQGVMIVGISKLMLSGLIHDERVLKSLVAIFFSPDMAQNQQVRQCLSYFFPAYCYSSSTNQSQMQKIVVPILQLLFELHREVEDDVVMVAPSHMALLMVDWTDPQKAIEIRGNHIDETVHIDLAISIIESLLSQVLEAELQKILVSLFSKLYLPAECGKERLFKLKLLLDTLIKKRPRKDAASKNALARFIKAFEKKYLEELEDFDSEKLLCQEAFAEAFHMIEQVEGEEGERIELPPPIRKRTPKARSASVSTQATIDESDDDKPAKPVRRQPARTPKVNRSRIIIEEEEDDDESEEDSGSEADTPRRPTVRKAQTRKPATRKRVSSPLASATDTNSESGKSIAEEEDEVDDLL